jgi:hypothetical protein
MSDGILVFFSYHRLLLFWIITRRGDLDTINPTVLTLMGISTAFGAAFITSALSQRLVE